MTLIQSIQGDTNKAVEVTDEVKKQVTAGLQMVTEAGESFKRIDDSIQEVSD